ncbi:MAG: VIT family protein [Ferruginibacter sp.]
MLHNYIEKHYVNRVGWLRASVLGANDGILSVSSIAIGVSAAATGRSVIILAVLAGLVSGAMSMAAGEYVSVSSQSDTEKADLSREKNELAEMPEAEFQELADIYTKRGLSAELAHEVAVQLTRHNALEAHARDELGINEITIAKPMQAALASFAAFTAGGILPLLVAFFAPLKQMMFYQYGFAMFFLVLLGTVAAKAGGSKISVAIARISFWGTAAMIATALVGHFFGTEITG